MDWQPIETAPKDGTRVLLAQGDMIDIGAWEDTSYQEQRLITRRGNTETYEWVDVPSGYWGEVSGIYAPTHWAALPTPPA